MVAKNKIHGRRIRQSLQQLHHRCLFQQLAVSPPGAKYVSVTAETKKLAYSSCDFRGPLARGSDCPCCR
ncbi:Uncharacterised protein [Salmonella enterica subsp. enterica serovar Pullorum]|uniref:Uncharacterized protein n=1 Tax=Salmonella enterica subsp. enterica serovar Daytona TaxID=1962639 RepID=A0A447JH48_SALET|nr:hypothetical protein SPUCDC_1053 [Salmonella enterica subsp. enterica serovar Gallinarum/Pullorum str. CDC1983-67]ETX34578.1 hypothetical protein SPFCAV_01037 [Salmonella enterica subsp. enterica serovar Gallinarum/Pullorum str. FCAV198]CZQ26123.1 Uncharacterised protein [Salmonella enterica subsp. enterica serovar Pullorum]SUG05124.1 Uncharacterised protein [Salmonella enterica subsp. enterica serovar Pullorum]VDY41296.1 Uncharacterised protein [Salmonella enterica subsp. enterica serovar D